MTGPNMGRITESLERSLQNCSLNHERRGGGGAEEGRSDDNNLPNTVSDTSLELNSHLSLPYHWEQCLDLKTGEIYYINWRTGMKASEDPRTLAAYSGDFYSDDDDDDEEEEEEEEEDDDDDDDDENDDSLLYDSEEVSSESSPSSCSKERGNYNNSNNKDNVLVVAGCKRCLMYFMVPKQLEDCPKCNDHLLHFDRSQTSFP